VPMLLRYVTDVIASWWRLARPNCRNAVIVRMRAGALGVEPALWKNNIEEYYATSRGLSNATASAGECPTYLGRF
jgi:hypothetical protein